MNARANARGPCACTCACRCTRQRAHAHARPAVRARARSHPPTTWRMPASFRSLASWRPMTTRRRLTRLPCACRHPGPPARGEAGIRRTRAARHASSKGWCTASERTHKYACVTCTECGMHLFMPARARTGTSTVPTRVDQQSWTQPYNYMHATVDVFARDVCVHVPVGRGGGMRPTHEFPLPTDKARAHGMLADAHAYARGRRTRERSDGRVQVHAWLDARSTPNAVHMARCGARGP